MIVKNKKERRQRHCIPFLLIFFFSILIIYFIFNNDSIRIKTNISFGHAGFLYLFDNKLYLIIIIIVFNFGNIYQVLILFYILIIPELLLLSFCLFNGTVKENEIKILYDYFILFSFFLFLGKVFFDKKNINEGNYNNYKGLIIYILVFLFLILCATNTLAILNSNIIFLDKIIISFLLSFNFYYFVFNVANIKQNDSLQLFSFIQKLNNNIITVSLFIMIIICICLQNDKKYSIFLSYLLYLLSNIIPLYGIIFEYKNIFNSSRKNWQNFNFDKDNNDENDNINSLISEITITKSIKWNKTTFFIDFLRLLVLIGIQIFVFYIFENYPIYNDNSFLYFVFSTFTFIIDKIILYWLRLVNMTYFSLERNSINSK